MARILLKYESITFAHCFGDSHEFPYKLTIERTSFLGLIKSIEVVNYNISMFQSVKQHHDHWDELIRTKKPLKQNGRIKHNIRG